MSQSVDELGWNLHSVPPISESAAAAAGGLSCNNACARQNELAPRTVTGLDRQPSSAVIKLNANRVRRRPIDQGDLDAVARVLHAGFPRKSSACFRAALQLLASRSNPERFPRFGFVLEAGTDIVGVLLTIFSHVSEGSDESIRCNMSCWYVSPLFRMFAPMLLLGITRDPAVTLVNISPASLTVPTIEAQGFTRYSIGAFAGVPAFAGRSGKLRICYVSQMSSGGAGLAPHELAMLQDHEGYGCISLVCTSDAGSFPLIFRRCIFRRFPVPCARLIYARDLEDISKFAGPIGRFLALRGMVWICVAAPAPLRNMPGRFIGTKFPLYFKGPVRPRPGDLAYTEAALLGF